MNLKTLLMTFTLFSSISALASNAAIHKEIEVAGEDLYQELVAELDQQGDGGDGKIDKTKPITVQVKLAPAQTSIFPHHDGDGLFDIKIEPTIFASTGSAQLGVFNIGGGMENHYFSTDVGVGFGNVNNENARDPGGDKSMTNISAAVRFKILSFLEVGIRGMNSTAGKGVSNQYLQSLNGIGYDVRINLFKQKDGGVNAFVNFSGMQKNTMTPNFIQAGLMINLKHVGTN
jgi:hypothetical protein